MSHEDYMMIFGSNIYANPEYSVWYEGDKNIGEKVHLFTLENSENGLLLTAELQGKDGSTIAKIDKNKVSLLNENLEIKGQIEHENGLTVTRTEDGQVIFNAGINEDGYLAVTGVFHVNNKVIEISADTVKIDQEIRQTIKGINVHGTFFVGIGEITITDEGLKFYTPEEKNCNFKQA
ncbi:MAG: hypothetical protein ACPK85_08265 [Methanosarcina sp.]